MSELLTLEEIKTLFDQDYTANQTTRISAADDRVFANVTQWDSSLLNDTQLSYRGEFDIVRKARRDVLSDMEQSPCQVDFEPVSEREGSQDLIEGLYLEDEHHNTTIEAYSNSTLEAVDCGIGGWELYTDWESNLAGDRNQCIRRRPLYEFNNKCFPDCNAKLLDKSDATRWTVLVAYSKTGYCDLYKKLTGEETDADPARFKAPVNFGTPEQSYVFPWFSDNATYYIARFYHRQEVPDKILFMSDPMGMPVTFRESLLKERGEEQDLDLYDTLLEQGYTLVDEKETTTFRVTLYIASGEDILDVRRVAGQYIPIVPNYGERTFVEDEEVWEGIVKRAKDPQRLRNFVMSYLGDLVARSPRSKPIFFPEQIAGYENMYQTTGADNNYAVLYQHRKVPITGEILPMGPVGELPAGQIPPALAELAGLTREAVEDVANPGLPNDIADMDLSGKAVELLQGRFDKQSSVYQKHLKHAKRYDGLVYSSMAVEVYDIPRKVPIRKKDGSRGTMEVMQRVMDPETGDAITLNDITSMEFRVYATIGPSYSTKRDKTIEKLESMAEKMMTLDPAMAGILMMKSLLLTDGPNTEDIRDYARKKLLAMGVMQPETEEEAAFVEEAQSVEDTPDAETMLAEAENKKGDAEILKAQNQQLSIKLDMAELEQKRQEFKVSTLVDVQGKKADIALKQAQANKVNEETRLLPQKLKLDFKRLDYDVAATEADLAVRNHAENNKMRIARYNAQSKRFEVA